MMGRVVTALAEVDELPHQHHFAGEEKEKKAMCDGSDSRVSKVSIGLRPEKSICSGFSLLNELFSEPCHQDKPRIYRHKTRGKVRHLGQLATLLPRNGVRIGTQQRKCIKLLLEKLN